MNIKKNIPLFLLMIGFAFCMQSCVSNKAFQTARTTPKGEFGGGAGMSFTGGNIFCEGCDDLEVSANGAVAEGFVRYGITDKLDLGLNFGFIGTAGADIKFQLVGDLESKFAASIGGGFGILPWALDSSEESTGVTDLFIPAYLSFHASENFALYLSPRYTLRTFNSSQTNYFGGLLGFRAGGEKTALFLEFGNLVAAADNQTTASRQINIGVGYNIR